MKTTSLITLAISCTLCTTVNRAQNVGINNATPAASAALDITGTNKGLLIPRVALTSTVSTAPVVAPATSLLVFNTATAGTAPNNVTPGYYQWNGVRWQRFVTGNEGWLTGGNASTSPTLNFLGTTDSVDLAFRTENTEFMRLKANGKLLMGSTSGSGAAKLDVFVNTVNDTVVYRGRNNSSAGTITQIGSIEKFVDFSNTIDLNNGSNSVGISINVNNNVSHDLQLAFDDAAKPGTNTWTIASDARLKDDVQPFKDGLETIGQINPVYYRYNGKGGTPAGEYYVGVLAQELQQATPYMVGSYEYTPNAKNVSERETYLDVNNGALTYILVNAVKELNQQVSGMKNALRTATDFGSASIAGQTELVIQFGQDFKLLTATGTVPVVTVTTVNSLARVGVKNITSDSFTVFTDAPAGAIVELNWNACSRMDEKAAGVEKQYTVEERSRLLEKVKMKKSVIRTTEEDAETVRRNSGNN
jgi:hypothetical protein